MNLSDEVLFIIEQICCYSIFILLLFKVIENLNDVMTAWDILESYGLLFEISDLYVYDLVDVTKEVLRHLFNLKYFEMISYWNSQDLYKFR